MRRRTVVRLAADALDGCARRIPGGIASARRTEQDYPLLLHAAAVAHEAFAYPQGGESGAELLLMELRRFEIGVRCLPMPRHERLAVPVIGAQQVSRRRERFSATFGCHT